MANNFCRFLSNGYRIKTEGTGLVYQPCCWYSKEINLINNPNFDQEKQAITEISDWVPECASCKHIENSGAYGTKSPRQRSFDEIPDGSIPDNVPVWMELSIDTTCNAACIMCGPWHSTTWRKQEVKFQIITRDDLPTLVDPMHWLEVIKQKFTLQYLRQVNFLGGEPFESPVPLEFLKLLKSTHGSLKDVSVRFQTNASIKPPDEVMALAAECKDVRFSFSIDGVGERFEYHRYPLKWERVQKNIEYIKSLDIPKRMFCGATLTPLSAWYYDEFEQWVGNTLGEHLVKNLKPNVSIGKIALAHTPFELRRAIHKKFGQEHPVSRLLVGLGYRDYKQCVTYLDQLDAYRKTNWREVFPEVSKYMP